MNLRPRRAEEPEVSLTPLIDVVFLLLIFFMVSTSFEKEAQLEVTLPETNAQPPLEQPESLDIVIDIDGRFEVDGGRLADSSRATVVDAIGKVLNKDSERPVVIRADAQTPHRFVVLAMDVLGELGVTSIAIASESVDEGG
jgi:biopolymer transport protein ExbD